MAVERDLVIEADVVVAKDAVVAGAGTERDGLAVLRQMKKKARSFMRRLIWTK